MKGKICIFSMENSPRFDFRFWTSESIFCKRPRKYGPKIEKETKKRAKQALEKGVKREEILQSIDYSHLPQPPFPLPSFFSCFSHLFPIDRQEQVKKTTAGKVVKPWFDEAVVCKRLTQKQKQNEISGQENRNESELTWNHNHIRQLWNKIIANKIFRKKTKQTLPWTRIATFDLNLFSFSAVARSRNALFAKSNTHKLLLCSQLVSTFVKL